MALDADGFIIRFPSFKRIDLATIDAKLVEARTMVDEGVYGQKFDLAVGYLAAHLLSLDPSGQPARLIPTNAKATRAEALTTYERQFRAIRASVVSGFRVVGS